MKKSTKRGTRKDAATENQVKRLYRSEKEKMVGGVCGGLAEYLDADPTVIRLLCAALILFSVGMGILLYLIAWIIIPPNPDH